MCRFPRLCVAVASLCAALVLLVPSNVRCQSPDSVLTKLDEGYLDSLASQAVQKIPEASLDEKVPKVLVIDFFPKSPGNSSRLATFLANRFPHSLHPSSNGLDLPNVT